MGIKIYIICMVILFQFSSHVSGSQPSNYSLLFSQLLNRYQEIKDLHPFIGKMYPIAIADSGNFYIFDYDSTLKNYVLIKKTNLPFDMPENIAASFPLSAYDARPSCIIGSGIISQEDIFVTIFHEFIHCAQMETGEQDLKAGLSIYKQAVIEENFMWEITHNFPYSDTLFTKFYSSFLNAVQEKDSQQVLQIRKRLRRHLEPENYEYMCWQEWKEGFARYIENRLRKSFSLPENEAGKEMPYNRISFYYGGDNYIRFLNEHKANILKHPDLLFATIFYPDSSEGDIDK